jgi:hypothetical protein
MNDSGIATLVAYPNPVSDKLYLSGIDCDICAFTISDMAGRIISETRTTDIAAGINLKTVAAGSYILSVTDNQGLVQTVYIIKE